MVPRLTYVDDAHVTQKIPARMRINHKSMAGEPTSFYGADILSAHTNANGWLDGLSAFIRE